MFNLNVIIYRLGIFLLLELSLFALYAMVEYFKEEKRPSFVAVGASKFIEPDVTTSFLSLKPMEMQIEKIAKVEETTVDLLEKALVHITPNSEIDIVHVETEKVKPIIYTKSVKLGELSIEDKKETFIDMLIPSILVVKHRLAKERKKVAKLLRVEVLSEKDALWLTKKRHIFKASNIHELYNKMELHPTSIIMAQAIIESGWGTSRFFEKANNVFGIWSFNQHEARIAASEKRGKTTIYLKKYKSLEASIYDYLLMLSTKDAYREFRERRLESQDPFVLVQELGRYSELGDEYIQNLKNTIKKNKLLAYDSYRLDI